MSRQKSGLCRLHLDLFGWQSGWASSSRINLKEKKMLQNSWKIIPTKIRVEPAQPTLFQQIRVEPAQPDYFWRTNYLKIPQIYILLNSGRAGSTRIFFPPEGKITLQFQQFLFWKFGLSRLNPN